MVDSFPQEFLDLMAIDYHIMAVWYEPSNFNIWIFLMLSAARGYVPIPFTKCLFRCVIQCEPAVNFSVSL